MPFFRRRDVRWISGLRLTGFDKLALVFHCAKHERSIECRPRFMASDFRQMVIISFPPLRFFDSYGGGEAVSKRIPSSSIRQMRMRGLILSRFGREQMIEQQTRGW